MKANSRASRRLTTFGILVSCLLAGALQTQPSPDRAVAQRNSQTGDSVAVHRKLSQSINKFQDTWRKAWRSAELKRHRPIDLNKIRGWVVQRNGVVEDPIWYGDRDARALTPDLRRYEAMLCYIGNPSDRAIENAKARTAYKIGTPFTKAEIAAAGAGNQRRGAASIPATPPAAAAAPPSAPPIGPSTSMVLNGGMTSATARIIRPTPDFGSICPSWNPPDLPLQLDEGEAIDLALPPKGREPLRRARETLIQELEQAQLQFPTDDWIAGQRVRFVYDQRAPARTIEAAKACAGTPSFCLALQGLAEAQAGQIELAERRYRAARLAPDLVAVTSGKGCGNEEAFLLLRNADASRIRARTCVEQHTLLEQMWWLADPLWSVPGNERYVAHESRRIHATVRAIGPRDERYIWKREGGGEAMRELVVRYGWPGYTYWPGNVFEDEINAFLENVTTRSVFLPHTAVEYSTDRTALIPAFEAISNPFALTSAHYDLNVPDVRRADEWWPQEHMMLFPKLATLHAGQDAQLRRDSSITFHLAIDDALGPLDTAATGVSRALLMGGYSPEDTRLVATTSVEKGQTLRFEGSVPSRPVVLSAEVLPRSLKETAMRLRYGWHPPPTLAEMGANDVALSEPLFLRMPNREIAVPNDVKLVVQYMAGSLSFARTEPLAVYWESYGFKQGDTLSVSVTVRRDDNVNAIRRIGAALGVASALRDSITVRWTEPDARHATLIVNGTKPVFGRSVALDLQALASGNYVILVEMRNVQDAVARSERRFVVR